MLAAISTTILSRRSCAETCSAMVSRSRLNKTRGPPDALRMCCDPPPQSQPAGSPVAGVKRTENNNFSHSAPPQALDPGRIGIAKTVTQFAAAHLSGRIANRGSLCQAKRLPEAITSVSGRCCGSEVHDRPKRGGLAINPCAKRQKIVLGFVEPVERMQRAHREFGIGGVDQHRELDFGGGNGADVDIALEQRLERLGCYAGMAAHAAADHRNLGHVGGAVEPRIADLAL